MKKLIRNVDAKRGIVQITTYDERWYAHEVKDPITGIPTVMFVPSVTWVAESYPKGIGFYKWLADKGSDEAEAIKEAAGDKGSKVHHAIEDLLAGRDVKIDDKYINPSTGEDEELTVQEYECPLSFQNWFKEVKPKIIHSEIVVWNDEHNYAGTIDFVAEIEKQIYIIDFKTGQSIWPSAELQVSAYKHAFPKADTPTLPEAWIQEPKLAILQLGYRRNKNGWKFTEIEDKFDLFLSAQKIWANDHSSEKPSQKDYPLVLSIKEPEPAPTKGRLKNSKQDENHA
jgi:hypothetical protein